jgi:hypothetical protein
MMEFQDAESLPDGGTTCITVVNGRKKEFITIDYSLPMDGRERHIYSGKRQFSKENQIEINSQKEKDFVCWLKDELVANFGVVKIEDFINGKFDPSITGKWFIGLNFLIIVSKERDYFRSMLSD